MELVYLWVEDYKNIHRQGFNFSPRFECEFKDKYVADNDGHEKLIDNCELIIKPKKHLENFFDKDGIINITAIIGENGSGKSNIIEIISLLRFEKKISKVLIIYLYKENLFIFSNSDKLFHAFTSFPVNIQNRTQFKVKNQNIDADELFNLILFNNALSDFTIQKQSYRSLKTSHYEGFYNGLSRLYSNDMDSDKEYLEFNSKFYKMLSIDNNFFDFLDKNYFFSEYRYELDFHNKFSYSIDDKYQKKLEAISLNYFHESGISYTMGQHNEVFHINGQYKQTYLDARKENLIYAYMTFYFIDSIISMAEHFRSDFGEDFINEIIEKNLIENLEEKYKIWNNGRTEFNVTQSLRYEHLYYNLVLIILKQFVKNFKIYVIELQNKIKKDNNHQNINNYLEDEYLNYYTEIKYINHHVLLGKIISQNFDYPNFKENTALLAGKTMSIKEIIPVQNKKYIDLLFRKGILNQNFLNSSQNYNLLSGGEKQFIKFFTNISYTLHTQSEYEEKQIVFLDEVDLSFHPNWQKKILKNIVDCVLKINSLRSNHVKYHLVFITHSPFILSDLPKENVIFLEKYTKEEIEDNSLEQKIGNCKNASNEIEINPFGANIHTLLSHGFFMKNGLMGEFAKTKINEIIDYLNDEKTIDKISTPQNQIKSVIDNIGEDLLRMKLTDMYFQVFTDEELEREKLKLLELQSNINKQIEAIERKQHDSD